MTGVHHISFQLRDPQALTAVLDKVRAVREVPLTVTSRTRPKQRRRSNGSLRPLRRWRVCLEGVSFTPGPAGQFIATGRKRA